MGQVYSRLSEEERQVIQMEIGNGTSMRRIAGLIGMHASTVSREVKRNTWLPSNESESYRPYRPKRLRTGPWTGRYYIAGRSSARPTVDEPRRAGRTVWPRNAYGRGRPNGCGADGPRCRSAAVCVWSIPATRRCAAVRRPCTGGSTPTERGGSGGPAACREATGGGAGREAVFCQIFVGRFGVSFSPFERLFLGRFGFGQSCGLSVIA